MKNEVQNGDRLTFTASSLVGPNNPIKGGDPVVIGRLAGVAQADATPGTAGPFNDANVVVCLKGTFNIAVQSLHHNITPGSTVYINPSSGLVSDDYGQVPYGVACDQVNQYATTTVRVRLFGATPGAIGADS